MRDAIARAIYEEPGFSTPWSDLPAERRAGWLADADRVVAALSAMSNVEKLDTYKKMLRAPRSFCRLAIPGCAGDCGSYSCGN